MSAADSPTLTIHRALGFWARLGGLLARPPLQPHEALYLAPCNSVHTFFMPYPIDVAFLDGSGRVVKLVSDLRPWRMTGCCRARAVVELRSGEALRWHITVDSIVPVTGAVSRDRKHIQPETDRRKHA